MHDQLSWRHLKQHHRDAPRFAVIAYGKLGGKELGYGSDLDVCSSFDYADEADTATLRLYGAFVRKLINCRPHARLPASCSTSTRPCAPTATPACS